MNIPSYLDGPEHLDLSGLIDVRGRLARHHKGKAYIPPEPAPVARQPLDDKARAANDQREKQKNRTGYKDTVLSPFASDDGGKRTVLG